MGSEVLSHSHPHGPPLKDQSLNFVKTDPKEALVTPVLLTRALVADGEIETRQGQGLALGQKPAATLRPEVRSGLSSPLPGV